METLDAKFYEDIYLKVQERKENLYKEEDAVIERLKFTKKEIQDINIAKMIEAIRNRLVEDLENGKINYSYKGAK